MRLVPFLLINTTSCREQPYNVNKDAPQDNTVTTERQHKEGWSHARAAGGYNISRPCGAEQKTEKARASCFHLPFYIPRRVFARVTAWKTFHVTSSIIIVSYSPRCCHAPLASSLTPNEQNHIDQQHFSCYYCRGEHCTYISNGPEHSY